MAYRVWKFPLGFDSQIIEMPTRAKVIHVNVQHGQPVLWAECIPDADTEDRRFWVIPTGEEVPAGCRYVGTAHVDWTVWHIYEPDEPF